MGECVSGMCAMRLKQLATDDDAVSPVIGVILMVAITVILAAVIASFVLGLGGQTQTTPQASMGWNWDVNSTAGGTNSSTANLTVSHESGESVKITELFLRGDPGNGSSVNRQWNGTNSTTIGDSEAVASGDSWDIANQSGPGSDSTIYGLTSEYDLQVIWQPEEGDTSATLGEDTGPDA